MFSAAHPALMLLTVLPLTISGRPGAPRWSGDGIPVCTVAQSQGRPAIVVDGAAGAIIAWADYRSGEFPGNSHIFAQRVRASGAVDRAWPPGGLAVCTARGDQGPPVMVSDGAGGAIVAWYDYRSGSSTDIYAQRVLASGTVDPTWPPDGLAICTHPGDQIDPAIVADGMGGAIVTWDDRRTDGGIYAQHVLASGVVDPAWPNDGLAICTVPGGQSFPKIVVDGTGGAIVAWKDERSDYGDIYAQHVLVSGVVDPAWPSDGRALSTAYEEQGAQVMVADGAGGAFVAWTDLRSGYSGYIDIYAQHVLASGVVNPTWPSNGRPISSASDDQYVAGIVSDRAGGAIVVWFDLRSNRYDIYAQHLLASGVDPAWPSEGLPINTAPPGNPAGIGIAADGAGGAIVVWDDARGTDSDIYAQRVRASGSVHPAWPTDGLVVCAARGRQSGPVIATDGAGRAIVTWDDYRSGSGDIYAQRVHPAASRVGRGLAESFGLHAPEPGPARGEVTIPFTLPAAEQVSLEVFDLAGRAVRTLAARQEVPAGTQRFSWDGNDHAGAAVKSGVYLVRLSTGGSSFTRKFVILQ